MAMAGGKEFIGRVSAGLHSGRDANAAATIVLHTTLVLLPLNAATLRGVDFCTISIHNKT